MGFFSKVWKGVKGTFKKIGKGIKKAYKQFGKFMGKIGIVGQVAMMFILPYVGGALMQSALKLASWGSEAGGLIGGIAKGAAWTLGKAQQFAKFGQSAKSLVTDSITGFFKTAGRYVGSKLQKVIPGFKLPAKWNIPKNYTLEQAKTEWWQESVVDNWKAFKDESSNFFSTSIESVLPESGAVTLSPTEKLTAEIPMTDREERLFGEGRLIDKDDLRLETTFPSGRVDTTYASEAGSISGKEAMEEMFEKAVTDPKTGIRTYTPPVPIAPTGAPTGAPTATPTAADPEITWGDRIRGAPGAAWDAGMARIGGDTASSLLSGEARGVWAKPEEPYSRRSGMRGTFQGEPPMLAPDQDLTAFMSFEDTYKPADPFGIWGGESNYRSYLNRFAPTQLKYA